MYIPVSLNVHFENVRTFWECPHIRSLLAVEIQCQPYPLLKPFLTTTVSKVKWWLSFHSVDCVGILKLRNADVEARIGVAGSKKKSTRARLVFRVNIPRPDGSLLTLQTPSCPILCSELFCIIQRSNQKWHICMYVCIYCECLDKYICIHSYLWFCHGMTKQTIAGWPYR